MSHINDPILVVVKELGEEVGELVHLQEVWRESKRMTRSKEMISSSIMISDRYLRRRYLEGGESPLEFIPVHRRIVCLCGEVQVWPVSCSQWWSLKYVNVGKGDDLMVI